MKSSVLILMLLYFSVVVNAQELLWQNTIGGGNIDELYCIQQTSDGGYIFGGKSRSNISGDKTEDSQGGYDYWIVKTDSLGNIQWQNTIGGSGNDELWSVHQTTDGGYILGGFSDSGISGDKTDNSWGDRDYWILKTDSNGNIQWQKTIGGSGDDQLYTVQQTTDGGFILGGYSISNISGDKTENSMGAYDYWIVKTDGLGNIQWQNTIGGSNSDRLNELQQTTDGGYIMGGSSWSNSSGDKSENNVGGAGVDFWIVKTDSLGNIQWENTIGGGSDDRFLSVQQTSDGGAIVGGRSNSNISGDKSENSLGTYDYWIIKIDLSGNVQWDNTIGGNDVDYLNSVRQTNDGGYILGGRSNSSISGDKTENKQGVDDYWIIKTDNDGNIQWQNTIGGSSNDYLQSIRQTADGGYVLAGSSLSWISGDKTESNLGNWDYWLVKLSGNFNAITGNVFADFNSNNTQDAGEPDLSNKKITEQTTGRLAFSEQNGKYSVAVLDSGNYTVNTDVINYYNTVPLSHNAYFSGILEIDSLNDFGFQPQGVFNDLCVTLTPLGPFQSGFEAGYLINYENYGTSTLTPTVIFFPDNNITYSSSSVTPSSVTPDSVIWNLPTLEPFETGVIYVMGTVVVGLPIGTLINSSVRIEPVAGDANPTCNDFAFDVMVTGSFDPNDILVNEDTLFTTQLAAQPWLEYTIRFQNTGNDTAFTVKVLNPIDTNSVEINSIEFLNASHPVNLTWVPWERNMEFLFNNILLPDSNINEMLSHGLVRYRIKPKTNLMVGDSIKSFAAIYFDFNEPVITNTAVTEIVLPTSINEISDDQANLYLYPNPASDEITLSGYRVVNNAVIKVMDILGNEVYSIIAETPSVKIPVKHFARGVYFVKCGNSNVKFVKN